MDQRENTQIDLKALLSQAESGDSAAQERLGTYYLTGSHGLKKDVNKAIGLLTLAAESDNGTAQLNLAYCYGNGLGVIRDDKKAIKLLEKAAEKDIPEAKIGLSDYYLKGICVNKDLSYGFQLCNEAALMGLSEAEFKLGELYYRGIGCKRDNEDAMKWLEKAADKGHIEAKAFLGYILIHHFGSNEGHLEKAVSVLSEAASDGNFRAQVLLGEYYFKIVDIDLAYKWFTIAWNNGFSGALPYMIFNYYTGLTVPQNYDYAKQLLIAHFKQHRINEDVESYLTEMSFDLLCKLAYTAKMSKKYDKAIEFFNRALAIIENAKDYKTKTFHILLQIAEIFRSKQLYGISKLLFNRAKWIAMGEGEQSLYQLAVIYELGLSFQVKNYDECKALIDSSLYELEGLAHQRWGMSFTKPLFE